MRPSATAPSLPLLTRAWRALYTFGYGCIEGTARLLFRPLFRVRAVGRRPRLPAGGVLLCPNHQSYLDPALLQLVLRRRLTFVMTNDFYAVRGARSFFRLVGALPVARGRMAWESMRRAAALARVGAAVVVFPEGRLSVDGAVNPFQRGVGMLARRARVPVVPVAIEGSRRAWPRGAKWLRRADVRVAVGDAMPPPVAGKRDDDQAFADGVRAAVLRLRSSLPPARP